MKGEVKQQICNLLEAPLATAGFELAEVVLSQYKQSITLRLIVYGDKGVSIDDCVRLSRLSSEIIDGTDLFEKGYTLEVSSPGLDRPLKTGRDYKYRIGETVRINFVDSKRKRLKAEIVSITDQTVCLKNDDGTHSIDLADIENAKLVF